MNPSWPHAAFGIAMFGAGMVAFAGMLIFLHYRRKSVGKQPARWGRLGGVPIDEDIPTLDLSDPKLKYRREMLAGLAIAATALAAAAAATILGQWYELF